jgi:hypothetical protein
MTAAIEGLFPFTQSNVLAAFDVCFAPCVTGDGVLRL